MSLNQRLRAAMRSSARKLGYEIRKVPTSGFKAAPIFDLAVQHLMLKRGEGLRFIQVGANDGKFGDPLRRYILGCDWRGVLVEPQPEAFEQLRQNYAGCEDRLFFENVAVTTGPQSEITLYRARASYQQTDRNTVSASSVASIDARVTSYQLKVSPSDLEAIRVKTSRLDDLVAKYALRQFDLLQIDTEGHEWKVLQTLDLSKTQPTLIQFETGHLSQPDFGRIADHLAAHGYVLYYGGHQGDSVAMHQSFLVEFPS